MGTYSDYEQRQLDQQSGAELDRLQTRCQATSTYRNPWHKPNDPRNEAQFTTDAKPVQVGRYQRFHRIKSSADGGNVYDFVLSGVCITQRAGPATAAQIDACPYAQETMRKLGFVS